MKRTEIVIGFALLVTANALAGDTAILLHGDHNRALVATCLSRDTSQKCTDLRLDFDGGPCLEIDSSIDAVASHLNALATRQYNHPYTAIAPAFNIAQAVGAHGNSENIGPYFGVAAISPIDLAFSPIEFAAYAVSSVSVTIRMHKAIKILKNFVDGKPTKKEPGVSNDAVFESMAETLAYPLIINSEGYQLPSCPTE